MRVQEKARQAAFQAGAWHCFPVFPHGQGGSVFAEPFFLQPRSKGCRRDG